MDFTLTASTSLMLVNLLFAVVALAVGFAAGAWVFGATSDDTTDQADVQAAKALEDQKRIESEKASLAASRLRDLAAVVATDVGEHNANIDRIEADLAAVQESGGDTEASIVRALNQISQANEKLQQKLQKAEKQIEAQAEEIRIHESDARTDSLTKIANRRAFDDEIKRRFSEMQRLGTQFSLVILDVDHFKKFNDTHGHQAGDEVLRHVGQALKKCGRDLDIPCRYGGEEFAFILPDTDNTGAGTVAERVRKTIEAMVVRFEGKELKVTASLGVAQAQSIDNPETLIRRADDALYESKAAGRNRSYFHIENSCVPVLNYMKNVKPEATKAKKEESVQTTILDALPGRTRFLEKLRVEVRQSQETGRCLSLLTAQLSNFGKIEKDFGHTIGRLMMDSVAQFLDNAIRERDVLGKLEDGRFVVLMPGISGQEADGMGNRLTKALAGCEIPLGDKKVALNTLMSVVELSHEDTPVTFIQRAETEFLLKRTAEPQAV